jgi:hypothetical protein
MLASKLMVGAVVAVALYLGARGGQGWYGAAALLSVSAGGYFAAVHTYRIALDDQAVEIRSVWGRMRIELADIHEISISHLASSAPFALTFHRKHGPPITWKVGLFGRGADTLLTVLGQRLRVSDEGRDRLRRTG